MSAPHNLVVSAARALTTHLPADEAFRALCGMLRDATGVARASLAIYDETRDDFVVVAVQLDEESKYGSGVRLPREGTRVGAAFSTASPQLGTNLAAEQPFQEDHFLAEEGMQTGLVLPLVNDAGHAVGTLNVDWRERDAVDETQMALFEALASLFANSAGITWWLPSDETRTVRKYPAEVLALKRPSLQHDLAYLKKLAAADASVLITGPTGSGKGVLARALHEWSPRAAGPFVKCDCAALTSSLIESDLFGHERGSFTGATRQRIGRFELANRGTVFLDEIGELPLEFQPKLLGVIEDRELMRVGGSHIVDLDVRIISATHRNLAEGGFRADLYHRLGVLEYRLPALCDCPEDVPVLAAFYVEEIAQKLGRRAPRLGQAALGRLARYAWPGNVRELANVIERAMLLSQGKTLEIDDALLGSASPRTAPTSAALVEVEAAHIRQVLESSNWQIAGSGGAAETLAMHPNTLRSRMAKLGIKRH